MDSLFVYDLQITNFLYSIRDPLFTKLLLLVTKLGGIYAVIVVTIAITGFLFLKKNYVYVWAFLVALFSGGILMALIKIIIKRPRPELPFPVYQEFSFSFPSGHATASIILYGFIAYFIWQNSSSNKIRLVSAVSALLVILLIGFSRTYLGVHYFSDVIAGYILGTLCLTSGIYIIKSKFKNTSD